MVVYTDKFQEIVLDKQKSYHTKENITVDNQQIKFVLKIQSCKLYNNKYMAYK